MNKYWPFCMWGRVLGWGGYDFVVTDAKFGDGDSDFGDDCDADIDDDNSDGDDDDNSDGDDDGDGDDDDGDVNDDNFPFSDLSAGGGGSLAGPAGSVSSKFEDPIICFFFHFIFICFDLYITILAAGMEAPLSLPSSPVSLRPLHLLLLLLLGLALLTLLLFSYGAFPSGDTPPTHPL